MTQAGDDKRPYIDAHVHVWTPDTQSYPLAAGFRRDIMQPRSFTPQELLAQAHPVGVGRIVLIQMSFYGWDNSYMLDTIAAQPQVFRGVAVINANQQDPAAEMRRLAKQGVTGFRIYPKNLPSDRWLDGPGMAAMWKCGAAERLAMCCLVNPPDLPAIDRMCAQYPDTPVVVDHLARIGVEGGISQADINLLLKLARHKNTYVKVSAFYALGRKQPPYFDLAPLIRQVYDAFGPQRLMWATDCPFQVVEQSYRDSIELITEGLDFLSAEDRKWLLTKTAEKVYFG